MQALLGDPARPRVLVWDAARTSTTEGRARRLRRREVEVWLGGDGSQVPDPGRPLTVVKSPGVGFDVALLSPQRTGGAEVIDELELGWRRCRRPVVAVTGTNGKSTTCAVIAAALRGAGHRVALAGNTEFGPPLTAVPDADWVVCEVSSFQLEAAPTFHPRVAVFTNLTPEHLDRHGTMERYGAAKQAMFVSATGTAGLSVVNLDDPFGRRLAGIIAGAGGALITYGFSDDADVRIEYAEWSLHDSCLRIAVGGAVIEAVTRLPGAHNARNVAAALAVGHGLGLPTADVLASVSSVPAPPGRWQLLHEGQPFTVVVDYAHTPDGLRQVLSAMRTATHSVGGGAVRVVFGAVGLPDTAKAHGSAQALSELSDELVLTTGSSPRSHRIARLAELRRAADGGARVRVVLDRAQAIESAVAAAEPEDVVAVLGVGALRRLIVDPAGTVVAHHDVEVARAALRQRAQVLSCA